MVFCRGCGKEIHESAPMCPHCGAPQGNPATREQSASSTVGTFVQAAAGVYFLYTVVGPEIVLVSIIVGFQSQSWLVGGATFAGLAVALWYRPAAMIFIVAMAFAWGLIGWGIGGLFSISAAVVLAAIGTVVSYLIHASVMDLTAQKD